MTKTISFGLLLLAAQCALAGVGANGGNGPTGTAPEIDPASAMTGLTLLAGAMLVLRGRRLKK
jgi:hypothetical protein